MNQMRRSTGTLDIVDGVDEHFRAGRGIARAESAGEREGELQKGVDVGEGRMNRYVRPALESREDVYDHGMNYEEYLDHKMIVDVALRTLCVQVRSFVIVNTDGNSSLL
jgi:hypothetical protein